MQEKTSNIHEFAQKDRKRDLQKTEELANTVKDPLFAKILKRSIGIHTEAAGDVKQPKTKKALTFDIYSNLVKQDPVEEGHLEEAIQVKKSPAPAKPVAAKAKTGTKAKPKAKAKAKAEIKSGVAAQELTEQEDGWKVTRSVMDFSNL